LRTFETGADRSANQRLLLGDGINAAHKSTARPAEQTEVGADVLCNVKFGAAWHVATNFFVSAIGKAGQACAGADAGNLLPI